MSHYRYYLNCPVAEKSVLVWLCTEKEIRGERGGGGGARETKGKRERKRKREVEREKKVRGRKGGN